MANTWDRELSKSTGTKHKLNPPQACPFNYKSAVSSYNNGRWLTRKDPPVNSVLSAHPIPQLENIRGCPNLICHYLNLIELVCVLWFGHRILAFHTFPSLHPSLSPYTMVTHCDSHPKDRRTNEGQNDLHNHPSNTLPCDESGNPCTQEPIISRMRK